MGKLFEKEHKFDLRELVDYSIGGIVSKQILTSPAGNITLFSFDKEQALSEHTAPFDAMLQVLDGEAAIKIADGVHHLTTGQTIIMPANIPHAVKAVTQFKMLLTMIKG